MFPFFRTILIQQDIFQVFFRAILFLLWWQDSLKPLQEVLGNRQPSSPSWEEGHQTSHDFPLGAVKDKLSSDFPIEVSGTVHLSKP